jgi:integrase
MIFFFFKFPFPFHFLGVLVIETNNIYTHLLEAGSDVTVVQSLLGHNEARTTFTYLHATKPRLISTGSPLDQ